MLGLHTTQCTDGDRQLMRLRNLVISGIYAAAGAGGEVATTRLMGLDMVADIGWWLCEADTPCMHIPNY